MSDLVVTVPMRRWPEWLAEGDCAGDRPTTELYDFYLRHRPPIKRGERLYVVAFNRLRGYAVVVQVVQTGSRWEICRGGDAAAVTIREDIRGFRGWRRRWWSRADEHSFPEWRDYAVSGASVEASE